MSAPKIPPEGVRVGAAKLQVTGAWIADERSGAKGLLYSELKSTAGILIPADGGDWVRREEYERLRELLRSGAAMRTHDLAREDSWVIDDVGAVRAALGATAEPDDA